MCAWHIIYGCGLKKIRLTLSAGLQCKQADRMPITQERCQSLFLLNHKPSQPASLSLSLSATPLDLVACATDTWLLLWFHISTLISNASTLQTEKHHCSKLNHYKRYCTSKRNWKNNHFMIHSGLHIFTYLMSMLVWICFSCSATLNPAM